MVSKNKKPQMRKRSVVVLYTPNFEAALCSLNDFIGESMTRNLFILSMIYLSTILSCSSNTTRSKADDSENSEKQTAEVQIVADIHLPSEGVFLERSGNFEEITAGAQAKLMQTNAERGFGFGSPVGMKISKKFEKIGVHHPAMNVSQLQVTRMKGIAVDSGHWFDAVDDANVAWLPERRIASETHSGGENIAEIELKEGLEPGFYIIHDDSFLRSRVSDDVSAYYPIIIPSKDGKNVWQVDADKCFSSFLKKYGEVIPLDMTDDLDVDELNRCAGMQRVAWKSGIADAESSKQYKARTVYLSRLLDATDNDIHRAMIGTMDASKKGLYQQLWMVDQYDLIQRLARLHKQYVSSGDLQPRLVQAVVDTVMNQPSRPAERKDTVDPIGLIAWYPFARVAETDPSLVDLFGIIMRGKSSERLLLEIVGAIQYRQLFTTIQKNVGLASWVKKVEASVPAAFKTRSATLEMKPDESATAAKRVAVGPIVFSGVPVKEQPAWSMTIKELEKEASACIPEDYAGQNAIMVLEQPLNGISPLRDAKGVLRDPFDSVRPKPAMTPEVADCILNVFARIPAAPALKTTQTAKVAVTIY